VVCADLQKAREVVPAGTYQNMEAARLPAIDLFRYFINSVGSPQPRSPQISLGSLCADRVKLEATAWYFSYASHLESNVLQISGFSSSLDWFSEFASHSYRSTFCLPKSGFEAFK
jgi:hypothetical protein